MSKSIATLAMLTGLLATSQQAAAAGFALSEQGASGMGNAYAGAAAVAEDASTIFFNPAGMTYLPDNQLVIAGHAIKPSVDFSNHGSRSTVGSPMTGGDGGDAGDWVFVPNLYYAKAVTERLRLGIGVFAPFGLKTEYSDGWVGRYHALKSDNNTLNFNPAMAFKVSDQVSLGAGLDYQRVEAELTNALDFGSICYGTPGLGAANCNALHITPQQSDGYTKVKGSDWSWGYNVGLIVQPTSSTRVGLSYRSEIKHQLHGHASFSGVPGPFATNPRFADGKITADLNLPAMASLSAFHQLNDRWDVLADVTWTEWSAFRELRVIRDSGPLSGQTLSVQPENWHDSTRLSLGANYRYSDALKLRAGVAYDESPVPNRDRTPRIPDNDRTWLALGANYRFNTHSSLDFGYTHIFIKESSVNQSSSSGGQLVGDYQNNVNILSLQYTHNF